MLPAAAAALALAALTGCSGAAVHPHLAARAIAVWRAHAMQACRRLAKAVADSGNPSAAEGLAGQPWTTWNNEMQAAIAPAVTASGFTRWFSPGMTSDLTGMVTHLDQPLGLAGNPSAAEVARVQADCASLGITAPVWPAAEIGYH